MYNVEITYALNGIICQVGCQRVVFTNIDEFLGCLRQYLIDPRKTEVEWRKNQMFHTLSEQPVAIAPPPPPNDYAATPVLGNGLGLTATQSSAGPV